MKTPVSAEAIKQLFTEARSYHSWSDKPVSDAMLRELYEVFKWGPTSVNANPARFLAVRSEEQKAKLITTMGENNAKQVLAAPVTIVVAYDEQFHQKLDTLFPAYDVKPYFAGDANAKVAYDTAFRNSSFQGAYLMLAARALGLDVGPLSGFDNAKVDELFLKGTTWKSNFLCMVGFGTQEGLYPRGPRLEFGEAVKIV